ncbi:MAG: DUF4945 domain-containing protein [Flavobacteriaceae bacterium]|nr:DUF4945 domain-containing protein [Flavobacteriaceae bacterium]
MKKYLLYFSVLCLVFSTSCYKDEVIDSKPGESLDPVTNLQAQVSENDVLLSWDLPSTYPSSIIQPVSVQIEVSINGKKEGGVMVIADNPESYIFSTYDPENEYRFTVKVMANIETTEPHVSDLLYSLGETVGL